MVAYTMLCYTMLWCVVRGQLFVRGGRLLVPGERDYLHRLLHARRRVLLVHALQRTTAGR